MEQVVMAHRQIEQTSRLDALRIVIVLFRARRRNFHQARCELSREAIVIRLAGDRASVPDGVLSRPTGDGVDAGAQAATSARRRRSSDARTARNYGSPRRRTGLSQSIFWRVSWLSVSQPNKARMIIATTGNR